MDLLNMNFDMSGIFSTASTFVGWLLIILYCILGGLFLWGIMYLLSFKNLVRVRQATASGYVIIDTKAREFTTKDGVKKWRFLKFSWIKLPVISPPIDYMEFTNKGKFTTEADRSADGTIHWRKRSNDPDTGDVFTSEERLVAANEMRRANEYKKTNMMDKVFQMATIFGPIIVMVLVFAFYGDITSVGTQTIKEGTNANMKLAATCTEMFSKIESCDCRVSNISLNVVGKGGIPLPPN
jgi:hypothetical protein